ncbi:MAG: ABC transporter permease [Candidatus Heimdallarchaeota archaeon]|nr:MAG: ABC transporter permease [Candidatus Heimdallarchaeota archaeon]
MFESRTQRRKKKLLRKKYKKAEELSGSQLAIAFRRFRKNKAGLLGLILSSGVILLALLADVLAPYDPSTYFLIHYPGYVPSYQPPGVKEGAELYDYTNYVFNPGFELPLSEWSFDWQIINLNTSGIPSEIKHGTYAAQGSSQRGAMSQDITAFNDLFFTELSFEAYLAGPDPATLSISFTDEDGNEDQIDLTFSESNSWESVVLALQDDHGLKVRKEKQESITMSLNVNSGSDVIVDNFELIGGKYFKNVHYMGTNYKSEDLFARLVHGARISLLVSFGAIIISLIIGLPLGLMAGYYRGRMDEVIMRLTDVFLTLPFYFVMILAIVVIQNTQWVDNLLIEMGLSTQVILVAVMVGLGIFGWMGITRLVRATIFQIRESDYVEAARCIGASNRRIMVVHILPNVLAPLIVVVTLGLSANILVEAGLAFLGFTTEDLSSWGRELSNGFDYATVAWWSVFFPAILIIIAVMSFNLLGDGLRDAFDPRLR